MGMWILLEMGEGGGRLDWEGVLEKNKEFVSRKGKAGDFRDGRYLYCEDAFNEIMKVKWMLWLGSSHPHQFGG